VELANRLHFRRFAQHILRVLGFQPQPTRILVRAVLIVRDLLFGNPAQKYVVELILCLNGSAVNQTLTGDPPGVYVVLNHVELVHLFAVLKNVPAFSRVAGENLIPLDLKPHDLLGNIFVLAFLQKFLLPQLVNSQTFSDGLD